MKGAIADPLASTSSTPTRPSVITMGASQYFLFSLMNCHNSLMTCIFDMLKTLSHRSTSVAKTSSRSDCDHGLDKDARTTREHRRGVGVDPNPSRVSLTRSASAPERK